MNSLLKWNKIPLFWFVIVFCNFSLSGQIYQYNTATSTKILEIGIYDNMVVINGANDFLVKCNDGCDTLINLTVPGPSGYFNNNLNVLDTSNFIVLSSASFPHHALVYKTADGGKNWNTLYDTNDFMLNQVVAFDTNEITGFSTFYKGSKTLDGGGSWKVFQYPYITSTAIQKYKDSVVCIGKSESFCFSSNRGLNWVCNSFVQASPRDFFFLSNDTVLAVSQDNNGIYFSSSFNQGTIWNDKGLPSVDPYGIYFFSKNEGYVVGRSFSTNAGVILKTTDLGKTWKSFDTGLNTTFFDIEFLNDSIAIICGSNGVLIKLNTNQAFSGIGLNEVVDQTGRMNLFPNPTSSNQTLQLQNDKGEHVEINLFDLSGKMTKEIYKGKANSNNQTFVVNLENLVPGLYIYKAVVGSKETHLKTLKN